MEINKYLEVLHTITKLKDTTRHCYTPGGRHESVAEHSWRITMMAFFLRDEFPDADMDKVIKMCLIHDIGEVFTGDIPSFDKSKADESKEENLLTDWVNSLPEPYKTEMTALYAEMDARVTTEARIYKALDNLEAVISHNESDLSTWIEKEYTLNLTYGDDKVAFSDYLTRFRALVRQETEDKIARNE
ncbi:MAG: HD domain-containing protein [Lachnospiraceae bacterium]|nr:HD domain-containing protein [Lachnospiraceae bacterium]